MSESIKGLEGIVAAETQICFIDGKQGRLVYRGYDIAELADHSNFEETCYLLLFGRLPNKQELTSLKDQLSANYKLPDKLLGLISQLPKNIHPMSALRTVVSYLSAFDNLADNNSCEANVKKSINLIAKIPCIVGNYSRHLNDIPFIEPNPKLSIAENFLYMLKGEEADPLGAKVFDVILILHADHELNASTFAARVAISTESDIYSAITAAIGTLKGPLHGGANQKVLEMLFKINSEDKAEGFVLEELRNKRRIMGFGHRVYKTYDPRALILRKYAEKLGEAKGDPKWVNITKKIDEVVRREKNLYPNVDLYSPSCMHYIGVPPGLYTCIFAMGRTPGWCAHALEQYADNRLIRPLGDYKGKIDLKYVSIDQRS